MAAEMMNHRSTVIKRPAACQDLSPFLVDSMGIHAAMTGSLEKLASSSWKLWQPRAFQLRGSILFYYKPGTPTPASGPASFAGSTTPLGAVDLRQIQSADLVGEAIILKSRTREIKLRAPPAASGSPQDPSLENWLDCITSVLSRITATASPAGDHASTATGEADILISDMYDETEDVEVGSNPLSNDESSIAQEPRFCGDGVPKVPYHLRLGMVGTGIYRRDDRFISLVFMWVVRVVIVALFLYVGIINVRRI